MNLPPSTIKDIAEELQMGMTCYLNKKSCETVFLPDEDNPYFEPELWQDQLDLIDQNPSEYWEIRPMTGHEGFIIMEDFADQIPDLELRLKVLRKLNQKRPFANFKWLVEESAFSDDWYTFKQKAYEEWVRNEIDSLLSR